VTVQESLPDEEKKQLQQYPTAQLMIESIQDDMKSHHQSKHKHIDAFCRAVGRISKSLEPYFAVGDVFMQGSPSYASLIWGSIRLVFKVCDRVASRIAGVDRYIRKFDILLDLWPPDDIF
jgi:hypothetical protein